MSEAEADFEIDFYGDDSVDQQTQADAGQTTTENNVNQDMQDGQHQDDQQMDDSRHDAQGDSSVVQQGTKRKSEEDHSAVDVQATTAIMISDLNWWITDDDVRGWLKQADCEDDVKDLTFSEHKVNGKSKGYVQSTNYFYASFLTHIRQVYVEFHSRNTAATSKRHVEQLGPGTPQGAKKIHVAFWNPNVNPFKTLPKDAPARGKDQNRGGFTDRGNFGGFRGRGGMNNRGHMGQNNFNRNFNNNNNTNNMGFNNNMGGFNNNNNMGNNYGFNRGGMMGGGMRGNNMRGRGGPNMMGMNPMGMPMGMPGNMPMGMMGGMQGFQGMPNFNAGNFGFNQNQGANNNGGDWGNPHGAKRPRPE